MIANRTLWRWHRGRVQTFYVGQRVDWAAGGVYETLGWVVPVIGWVA